MKDKMQTGVQQVQLRTVVKTQESAQQALQAIRTVGFDGIELNRYMLHKLPVTIRLFTKMAGMEMGAGGSLPWREMVEKSGLSVIALHTDLGSLEKDPQSIFDEAKALRTDRIVLTGMYHYDYGERKAVSDLAARLNRTGETCRDAGFRFLYHNHNCEYVRDDTGTAAFERLTDETDPELVSFEFDCFWAAETGADVLEQMKRLGNRLKLLHINDRGIRPQEAAGSILKSDGMELGTGNMPLEKILRQAADSCEAVILEMHRGWIGNDPVRSMQMSGEWLMNHRSCLER
ncbi:MAG: sugar phosphate isomerase/epimerase [Firmicutes bacterium]|nr:sugar phosphate isomerase/epimerase [Bacillota bacterium]